MKLPGLSAEDRIFLDGFVETTPDRTRRRTIDSLLEDLVNDVAMVELQVKLVKRPSGHEHNIRVAMAKVREALRGLV